MGAHSVSLEIQHLLLKHVFHVPTGTVKLFIEPGWGETRSTLFVPLKPLGRQIGDHKARIFPLRHHFGFANDPAWAAPTVERAILKLGKRSHTGRPTQTMTDPGVDHRRPKFLDQNRVLRQAQAVVNLGLPFAPGHDLLPTKTAVPTHDDP